MNEALVIRSPTPSDFAAWKPLWDGYNAFYGRTGPTALDPEITRATWARFLDDGEPVYALLAESGGRLLGLAHFIFHRSTILLRPTCYLQDLFTLEGARGKGVGRALIRAVYERATAAGAPGIYWHTQEKNAVARRLYDSVARNTGFIVYRNP